MTSWNQWRLPKLPDTWPGTLSGAPQDMIYAKTPEDEYYTRLRLAAFAQAGDGYLKAARHVVRALGLPIFCPRPQCRRAKDCATPYVTCFAEHCLDIMRLADGFNSGKLDYQAYRESVIQRVIVCTVREGA